MTENIDYRITGCGAKVAEPDASEYTIRVETDEDLRAVVERVCPQYGFETCLAHFGALKEFKVSYARTWKWIDLTVSDYMIGAPEAAMESLIKTICQKINNTDKGYEPALVDWLTSEDFVTRNQPTFIVRNRLDPPSEALEASRRRLVDAGLVEDNQSITLALSQPMRKCGYWSCLMKVAAVNPKAIGLSESALDFCTYTAMLGAGLEFETSPRVKVRLLKHKVEDYPEYDAVVKELEAAGIGI